MERRIKRKGERHRRKGNGGRGMGGDGETCLRKFFLNWACSTYSNVICTRQRQQFCIQRRRRQRSHASSCLISDAIDSLAPLGKRKCECADARRDVTNSHRASRFAILLRAFQQRLVCKPARSEKNNPARKAKQKPIQIFTLQNTRNEFTIGRAAYEHTICCLTVTCHGGPWICKGKMQRRIAVVQCHVSNVNEFISSRINTQNQKSTAKSNER